LVEGNPTSSWQGRSVLVTGGASFIGSHLVDALVARGARVRVVDNLTSGKRANIAAHVEAELVDFWEADLRDLAVARGAMHGIEVVFHLAADHGGRGYVELHQGACAGNLALDGVVFLAALEASVDRVVFASSGCVYPMALQGDPEEIVYLHEDVVRPPYDADNSYGWAKLMAEMTLRAYYEDFGLRSACCRYFTVYGPRGVENHAVMAMIARAFVEESPFAVWGTGEQVRNWTYIDDIVEGTLLAAEKIEDASPVNLGTMERVKVVEAVGLVLDYTGHRAELEFHPELPTGPLNRVADNARARELLGWSPRVPFAEGLRRTIDWYYATHEREPVANALAHSLTER
jgi:nucleoside-diphosphate-sugar epimerase